MKMSLSKCIYSILIFKNNKLKKKITISPYPPIYKKENIKISKMSMYGILRGPARKTPEKSLRTTEGVAVFSRF